MIHFGLCDHQFCDLAGGGTEAYPRSFWFSDCIGQDLAVCTSRNTAYPVDFWLIDTPTYPTSQDQDVIRLFPDKAMEADQVAYFPLNFGSLSPRALASYLNYVTGKLNQATRVHAETACTPNVDVTSDSHTNWASGGLQGGQFACYDADFLQSLYLDECDAPQVNGGANVPSPTPAPTLPSNDTTSDASHLAISAIVMAMAMLAVVII